MYINLTVCLACIQSSEADGGHQRENSEKEIEPSFILRENNEKNKTKHGSVHRH